MSDDNQIRYNTQQPGQPLPPRRPRDWDQTSHTRLAGGIAVCAGIFLVLGFGLTALSGGRPTAAPETEAGASGYGILHERVQQAFGNDTSSSAAAETTPSAGNPAPGQDDDPSASPEERQARQAEEERKAMEMQEELRDQQREDIPSLIPENAPPPAPLGKY